MDDRLSKVKRTRKAPKPTGYVVWRGPSLLDGAPIVVIAVTAKSSNRKTGGMVQTYILRADMEPIHAVREALDVSICGDCKHRGDGLKRRSCYVNLGQGPTVVYRKFARGGYPDISGDHAAIRALGVGRRVRLGTYGDPAAAPIEVWQAITSAAEGRTGYTHQWRNRPDLASLCMASVDSIEEKARADAEAWRTFRVATAAYQVGFREVLCPASAEAGKRTTCASCLLCSGTESGGKSVVIPTHGAGRKHFREAA